MRGNYGITVPNEVKWSKLPHWSAMPRHIFSETSVLGRSTYYKFGRSRCEPGNVQDLATCISQNYVIVC
jgi:hypothetical protein